MYINGIDFPNEIINAANESTLVVFAGAGVSMGEPTCLPNFEKLTEYIAEGTLFKKETNESCEAFLGRLKSNNINVNKIAAERLSELELKHNCSHEYIIDLFPDISKVKIVTTNYDYMFEKVFEERGIQSVKSYSSPALPLGNDIKGIIHIHGEVMEPEYMVLTDEDFGIAYLSEGYVSRFLVKLFEKYTVLFVGYSYNDMIVRYLTRAMTKSRKNDRFVLTDSVDNHWSALGIRPILYDSGKHKEMYEGLNSFGERMKRGLWDWKDRLCMLGDVPPADLSAQSELEFCLSDVNKTRILLEYINGEEWLTWVDERNLLNSLFNENVLLNEAEKMWLNWLIDNYVGNKDDLVKRLIIKHGNHINKALADKIIDKILFKQDVFNDELLKEYVILLNPFLIGTWQTYELIGVVMDRGLYHLGWSLYKSLFTYKMVLEESYFSSLGEKKNIYKHHFISMSYCAKDIWERFGNVFIEHNSLNILHFGMDFIEKIHFDYAHLGQASREVEPFELIANISFNEKRNNHFEEDEITVLENALLSAFFNMEKSMSVYSREYLSRCIKSESPLLRVVGLKMLKDSSSFNFNEKAELLLENISLYSLWEKETIFKLISNIFDQLKPEIKERILDAIENGPASEDDEIRAYQKYNWCVWLKLSCEDNQRVNEIIKIIKFQYPHFQERERPEVAFYSEAATWTNNTSPVSKDEMMMMDVIELKKILTEYNKDDWEQPNRAGLLDVFSDSVASDFYWTIQMLEMIIKHFPYDSDVWNFYFIGLGKSNFSVDEYMIILRRLAFKELIEIRNVNLVHLVEKILKLEAVKIQFDQYENELSKIQDCLWKWGRMDVGFETGRLIDRCYNCSTGLIVSNWIHMLSYENKESIPEKYKRMFAVMLEDDEKLQVICILVGQMRFLFHRDNEWTKAVLFPLLQSSNSEVFKAAWTGIVWFSRNLYEEMADELKNIYCSSIKRIDELKGEVREGLVDLYTLLTIYVIDNPIPEYIPAFFNVAKKEDKTRFAQCITHVLSHMKDEQKYHLWDSWLKKYWINRTKNIPVPLDEGEKTEMMDWFFEMKDFYTECISIFLSQNNIQNVKSTFWIKLKNSELIQRFPDDTAKLLTFILNSESSLNYRESIVMEIARTIICEDLCIENEFKEALLKRGLLK